MKIKKTGFRACCALIFLVVSHNAFTMESPHKKYTDALDKRTFVEQFQNPYPSKQEIEKIREARVGPVALDPLIIYAVDRGRPGDTSILDNYRYNSRYKDGNAIRLLVDFGVDINAKGMSGDTALHRAVRMGETDADTIKLLLQLGAKPTTLNQYNQSVYALAEEKNVPLREWYGKKEERKKEKLKGQPPSRPIMKSSTRTSAPGESARTSAPGESGGINTWEPSLLNAVKQDDSLRVLTIFKEHPDLTLSKSAQEQVKDYFEPKIRQALDTDETVEDTDKTAEIELYASSIPKRYISDKTWGDLTKYSNDKLYQAIRSERVTEVERLLKKLPTIDVNHRIEKDDTGAIVRAPLLFYTLNFDPVYPNKTKQLTDKKIEIVNLLISSGATVDTVDFLGNTPLIVAVYAQDKPLTLLLLRAGADTQKKNILPKSALDIAQENKFPLTELISKVEAEKFKKTEELLGAKSKRAAVTIKVSTLKPILDLINTLEEPQKMEHVKTLIEQEEKQKQSVRTSRRGAMRYAESPVKDARLIQIKEHLSSLEPEELKDLKARVTKTIDARGKQLR